MGISNLRHVIDLEPGVVAPNGAELLAAGPITKQPGTNAFRIVLVSWHGQFVVWTQIWPTDEVVSGQRRHYDEGALSVKGGGFADHGDYFSAAEFAEATLRFAERVSRSAGTIKSIYRDVVAA